MFYQFASINAHSTRFSEREVIFVNASTPQQIENDLQAFVRSKGAQYKSASYPDALSWLTAKEAGWMLILDSADQPSMELSKYIPKHREGSILITTRNPNYAALSPHEPQRLSEMPEDDAVSLLLRVSRYPSTLHNTTTAKEIVSDLGYLALAISQAAGYIFKHRCLGDYRRRYRESRKQILSTRHAPVDNYEVSVYAAISLTFCLLSKSEQELMYLFSCLQCSSIPHTIIQRSASTEFQYNAYQNFLRQAIPPPSDLGYQVERLKRIFCPDGHWSSFEFDEMIGRLEQHGLLSVYEGINETRFSVMHVIIRAFLHDHLSTPDLSFYRALCIRLLTYAILLPDDSLGTIPDQRGFYQLLSPHVRELVTCSDVFIHAADAAPLSEVMWHAGDYSLGETLMRLSLAEAGKVLSEDHEDILTLKNELALILEDQGRLDEALAQLR